MIEKHFWDNNKPGKEEDYPRLKMKIFVEKIENTHLALRNRWGTKMAEDGEDNKGLDMTNLKKIRLNF